jgi:hypothetical protein
MSRDEYLLSTYRLSLGYKFTHHQTCMHNETGELQQLDTTDLARVQILPIAEMTSPEE